MAEYIEREATIREMKMDIEPPFKVVMKMPAVDVVPKSEADRLEYTLLGVMHSVDKWLDGDELKKDEVNRAITMREKTLRIIERAKRDAASEVIDEFVYRLACLTAYGTISISPRRLREIAAELKKKYAEGEK